MRSLAKTFGFLSLLAFSAPAPAASLSASFADSNEELRALDVSGILLDAKLFAQIPAAELTKKFANLGIQAKYGVKLYRVSYISHTPKKQIVKASGLVAVPDAAIPIFPWISLQHGTIAAKAQAPSLAPSEGLVEASQGFIAVVADYLGYGDSKDLFHPYIIAQSYVDSNVAMLRASRSLAQREGWTLGPMFLKGYSEGGYATLALQRALETQYQGEFPIVASAPSAGPYDPDASGRLLATQEKLNPINVPFIIISYNKWFGRGEGLDLDKVFIPEAAKVEETLSGAYTSDQIHAQLPSTTAELLAADFLSDFVKPAGEEVLPETKTLHSWLRSQSLLKGSWVPKTQTRFFHCVDDEQVPAANQDLAIAHFKNLDPNAPVSGVMIPSPAPQRYTHGNCPGIFAPLQWFAQILTPPATTPAP